MAAPLDGGGKSSKLSGWFRSLKSDGVGKAPAKAKGASDQWERDDGAYLSLWSPDVASAMGYGKGGRSGSAYQWWIVVLSTIVAFGSFIAWCIFIFRARDATQAAVSAMKLTITWWETTKSILLATAVCYPLFALLAIGVSLWRAHLARQLNIHAPNARWMSSCRAFQVANVVSSLLLYGMFILMVVSIASHAVWAYTARAAHYGSYFALKYVDPVWSGVSNVVNASETLVDNFVGLTQQLPGVSGRRLTEFDPVTNKPTFTRALSEADVAAMPKEVIDAGVAAARSLQQLPELVNGLGTLLNGAASAMNSVPVPQINTAALPNLPFLPQILPNGTDNPLFQTLSGVTNAVQQQVLNGTGCPMYCVDLRDQPWIQDGCICNLDRVRAAYPHLGGIFKNTVPAIGMVFTMMVASTWLLLHAASQWARTRSEVKLLQRLPNAAQLAAQQQAPLVNGGGSGYDVPVSKEYQHGPLPSV